MIPVVDVLGVVNHAIAHPFEAAYFIFVDVFFLIGVITSFKWLVNRFGPSEPVPKQ